MTWTNQAKEYSLISLDLPNNQAALALAQKIAERTGLTVTVRDVEGIVIARLAAAIKN